MVRSFVRASLISLALLAGVPAYAMQEISSRETFLNAIDGRELVIRLYGLSIEVTPDGRIAGRAVGRDITGDWTWQEGYFCREIMWGSMEIPYNCQLVEADSQKMRFTTDRGAGEYADFRLR